MFSRVEGWEKTALLRFFQKRINSDWGLTQFGGQFYAAVVYVAFSCRRQSPLDGPIGMGSTSSTSVGTEFWTYHWRHYGVMSWTEEQVDAVVNANGDLNYANLLDSTVLQANEIDPANLCEEVEQVLLDARVERAPAQALARGRL